LLDSGRILNFLNNSLHEALLLVPAIIQYITPKLSSACFAMRIITETLKVVYFAYFHSIVSYGIIFWGNATQI
jgi:hypothetical protein